MSVRGNSENCVEEPVAPEWLSKLESRRENLQRATKLSHEVGAGAPCGECGEKCPGLDLHFWRKVCRNCKCRKDQHKCVDDDLSSWAQFEILGQICSKPACKYAYICTLFYYIFLCLHVQRQVLFLIQS